MNDRWLETVRNELKSPVEVRPGFEGRVVTAVKRSRRNRRLAAVMATVVGAAAVLLVALRVQPAPIPLAASGTEVEFAIDVPSASAVTVVGDFNDWDRARTPLVRAGAGSRWTAKVSLAGGVYQYAYLIDGVRLVADPNRGKPVDGDYGQSVSLLAVAR